MKRLKNTFCSYCGTHFGEKFASGIECPSCGIQTFVNPTPVSVILLPVIQATGTGVILVRRGIEPMYGELALPGGYVDHGESSEEAAMRELAEETGIVLDPKRRTEVLFTRSAMEGRLILTFCLTAPLDIQELKPPLVPPAPRPGQPQETLEIVIADKPLPLAFSTHTEALDLVFERLARKRRTV